MAKRRKKAAGTTRRKRRTTSAVTTRRRKTTAPRRRRTTRRVKKGMLSEFFTPAVAMQSARTIGAGGAGGVLAYFIDKATPNQAPIAKALWMGAAAFVTAGVMRQPAVGAGIAGGAMYELLKGGGLLSENGNANYAQPINKLPMFLSENNSPMTLAQGQYMLSQRAMNMPENQPVGNYPSYIGYGMY